MRKIKAILLSVCVICVLSSCGSAVGDTTTEATTEITTREAKVTTETTTEATTKKEKTRATTEATTEKTYEHICEATGCTNEGTKTITGISGEKEYYCTKHYNEIQSTLGDMEEDVGKGSASKHTCEASGCSKEGTHSLTGLGGNTEYYCTEHYNEIVDMLNKMSED